MWPFRRRKPPGAANVPSLTIDPAMGDETAKRLIAASGAGDWRTIAELLSAVEDPDDHTFYVHRVAWAGGVENWIDDWVAAEPRSALPLLVKGAHAIDWAWEARGGGRANTVSREAFKIFFKRLKLAEDCLDEVTERDADSATPWSFLVILGRGRQLGVEETRRRFEEARKRHPWHVEAHEQMLQQLCRKWGGSHEEMHRFAAETLEAMPAGSPLGQLTAAAHVEHWLDLPRDEDDEYIRSAEIRAELVAAANRSILHPEYVRRPRWPTLHNAFAMTFAYSGELAAAAEQFDAIGDLVTEWPWQYGGRTVEVFLDTRERVFGDLGR
ncbi:hypothetical protein GCM10027290_63240 [Micromonospora sonneratiae]|uniref:DUF4034 domain-containing protein n=1 Tax=Micromonospora sonneratiae TaxID=1184706 RepID=A0ABW3YI19_9ACTN